MDKEPDLSMLVAEWKRLEDVFHDALPQGQGEPGDGGVAGRALCQFLYDNSDVLRAALTRTSTASPNVLEVERLATRISELASERVGAIFEDVSDGLYEEITTEIFDGARAALDEFDADKERVRAESFEEAAGLIDKEASSWTEGLPEDSVDPPVTAAAFAHALATKVRALKAPDNVG